MSIHLSCATRLVAHAGLFFDQVTDARRAQGKRHPLPGVLTLAVLGFALGHRTTRGQEGLAEDLGAKRLRRLGLSKPVSDTRLYDITKRLLPDDFREVLFRQVEHGLAQGAIRKDDLLPHGAMAIDGKGAGSGMGNAPNAESRQSTCDAEGTPFWDVFALRGVLTSSLAQPCLNQVILGGKQGEATALPGLLEGVNARFGTLVRYVTADAGLTSLTNAAKVIGHGQHYAFAVKGNQPKLHATARKGFLEAVPVASSFERAQGKTVDRFLCCVPFPSDTVEFPGATELWCVQSVKTAKNGEIDSETRYFVVSIPPAELTATQKLLLVRLHWGIENNSNWTADVVLKEDTQCPVKTGNGGLVVSWLTMLALNILAMVRANLNLKDLRPPAWKRVQDKMTHALFAEEQATEPIKTLW